MFWEYSLLAFADSFDLALLKFWGLIDLVLGFWV